MTPDEELAAAQVRGNDHALTQILRDSGQLEEGEILVDAVLVFASVRADRADSTGYGFLAYGGAIPHYRLHGLLDEVRQMHQRGVIDDED